jgi:F0F1-type ATP synthase assembly protein I
MFNPTRSQLIFVAAIVIGLILGKLIKNYKVAFAIAIILIVGFSINFKKKK